MRVTRKRPSGRAAADENMEFRAEEDRQEEVARPREATFAVTDLAEEPLRAVQLFLFRLRPLISDLPQPAVRKWHMRENSMHMRTLCIIGVLFY